MTLPCASRGITSVTTEPVHSKNPGAMSRRAEPPQLGHLPGATAAFCNSDRSYVGSTPWNDEGPPVAGPRKERMMGFEPTTYAMARRRSSQLSYIRTKRRV